MIPVYVLHCQELADRTATCRAHLKERGIVATFWRGLHGNSWGLETRLEYDPGKRISPGHVGLNVGIWNLWQHIHLAAGPGTAETDPVITFEDDVEIPDEFEQKVTGLRTQLDRDFPDWDLVFLGLAQTEPHVWNNVTERVGPPDSRLCRLTDPFGTHALMTRRRALPILLENMTVAQRNLDQQLYERVLKPGLLNWCAVLPSMVTQRTFDYRNAGAPQWKASTIDPALPSRPVLHVPAPDINRDADRQTEFGRPSVELYTATMKAVDPLPCIYRGENTEDVAHTPQGKSVPLFDCTRFDKPCHTKLGVTTQEGDVLSCHRCGVRTEMASDSARERLPLPDGHFNPSMILWNRKLILATRDSWGHSKVALWELNNSKPDWGGRWTVKPIGSFASKHPDAPRLEDPRLFISLDENGRPNLCAMFNLPDGYPPKRVRVGYIRFAPDLSGVTDTMVYGSPHANLYEKNWVPFADEDGLHWVYSTKPEHLVLGQSQNWATKNDLPWTGGVIRGGAAPVLTEIAPYKYVYTHFFHGALKRVQGTVYTVGCCQFEPRPPYQVLRQTRSPLVWPDLPAVDEDVVKRYVIWPGGAVPHAGKWHLACGIDDTNVRIISIPFATVENSLNDIPETRPGVGLRDSVLATGELRDTNG